MLPPLASQADPVRFFIPEEFSFLTTLPWNLPLEQWDPSRVRLVDLKSGLSRHVVRFFDAEGRRFAVKETAVGSATREYERYLHLARLGIPTLRPVGVVVRDEGPGMVATSVGTQLQPLQTGYLLTLVMDKVIPDSYLFRRAFSKENRTRIWDAIVRLFVRLHTNGVYWGDASLANMLVQFHNETVPGLGWRTALQAVLADAETVEIHPGISPSLRLADVEFFLESMLWTEADLKASGIVRDPMVTLEDQTYLRTTYRERFDVEQEMRSFELITHIDVDRLLGDFVTRGFGRVLLKHIQEHKWYLSERRGKEVSLVEAAEDWYGTVFKPVCTIFSDHGLLEFFPDTTAASLYVHVMQHKYFMSEIEGKDVGLLTALEDYVRTFAQSGRFHLALRSIVQALTSLFRIDDESRHHVVRS